MKPSFRWACLRQNESVRSSYSYLLFFLTISVLLLYSCYALACCQCLLQHIRASAAHFVGLQHLVQLCFPAHPPRASFASRPPHGLTAAALAGSFVGRAIALPQPDACASGTGAPDVRAIYFFLCPNLSVLSIHLSVSLLTSCICLLCP